ncbi:DUF2946 domain-containing protein [Pseudomonas sp. MAP12]|uniref:DUF2946 domain-containing protein n=1 Tax=Geopseudomonas aromaticivorans TaxID=2849492 RepID=A0ABS6MZF7_9GAMM|nr:DUF2946 domain-containing protein [Pseudomonas aromaticivorans]MBV2133920.1 DUF2946 domain-containing protein [Pseudomonas aromaticivorans]
MRLAAWLGLFAMLMAFAGPLYSQLRALDSLRLSLAIDLETLHCAAEQQSLSGAPLDQQSPAEWVQSLEQCGYCNLLAHTPSLPPSLQLALPAPSSHVHQYLPPSESLPQAPPASQQARAPPALHA